MEAWDLSGILFFFSRASALRDKPCMLPSSCPRGVFVRVFLVGASFPPGADYYLHAVDTVLGVSADSAQRFSILNVDISVSMLNASVFAGSVVHQSCDSFPVVARIPLSLSLFVVIFTLGGIGCWIVSKHVQLCWRFPDSFMEYQSGYQQSGTLRVGGAS